MAEIFRVYKQNNFTVMSNHHLRNNNLSLKAIGLLSKLLSLPNDWNISIRGMAKICKDGYDSIRTAFSELISEGYVIRRKMRNQSGKISGTEYIVRESPDVIIPEEFTSEQQEEVSEKKSEIKNELENMEKTHVEKPITEGTTTKKPIAEKSTMEKPTTEKPITEKLTTEKPTMEKPTTEKPTMEKPTTEKPTTEKPTMEKPTTEKPSTVKPTTEKPTTENPCGLKTNIYNNTKTINTKSLNIPPPPEENMVMERIKRQIDYDVLLVDNNSINLDAIVKLLIAYESGRGQYAYIDGKKVLSAEIKTKFQKLTRESIEIILCSMENTKINNIHNYLISALYQTALRVSDDTHDTLMDTGKIQKNLKYNSFNHNFHQRNYDYDELEKKLLSCNM